MADLMTDKILIYAGGAWIDSDVLRHLKAVYGPDDLATLYARLNGRIIRTFNDLQGDLP